ncbi:unnamed protein product [Adineta steineri]|uniref:Uncharacterized protein n=1 Tax=Adineta steineri TaxID=433720 RepID=A0A815ZBQ3_9BILA|nr:unnamed protein product [Adineta steineri]CAF1581205.1 unnamed protein product [Adineta steineri]
MATRNELCLHEKINPLKEKENALSHRPLSEKFNISIGAVSNILERKLEYTVSRFIQNDKNELMNQIILLQYLSFVTLINCPLNSQNGSSGINNYAFIGQIFNENLVL